MKLIKDKENPREDYLLQNTKKTTRSIKFISAVVLILIAGVIISGFVLGAF